MFLLQVSDVQRTGQPILPTLPLWPARTATVTGALWPAHRQAETSPSRDIAFAPTTRYLTHMPLLDHPTTVAVKKIHHVHILHFLMHWSIELLLGLAQIIFIWNLPCLTGKHHEIIFLPPINLKEGKEDFHLSVRCDWKVSFIYIYIYINWTCASEVDCGTPFAYPGSNYSPLTTTYNSQFVFGCTTGNTRSGSSQMGDNIVRCTQHGYWDFGSLYCYGMCPMSFGSCALEHLFKENVCFEYIIL